MKKTPLLFVVSFFCGILSEGAQAEPRWWKGNLHTHSLWSDGDDFPEMIADWYLQKGYHFLALSDHNILSDRERWISRDSARVAAALPHYVERFGSTWVEQRGEESKREVRLKMLSEFRGKIEQPGRFLMIQSEEITARFSTAPVHVNATNVRQLVMPPNGSSVIDVLQKCFHAVAEQRKQTGVPMFAHLNHPNYGWAVTAEELMVVDEMPFFEVYNGHPTARNRGDARHAGTEKVWDIVLSERLSRPGKPLVFGLGTDDSHNYVPGKGASRPGRGWVVVRAEHLEESELVEAMERGDFYASNGVRMREVARSEKELRVEVDPDPGVEYTIEFIGTRKGYSAQSEPVLGEDGATLRVTRLYDARVGEVFSRVKGTRASYAFTGDEWYVRAVVRSNRIKADGAEAGELETAWIQPVRGPAR
jgi:hypothetical protein